jgi:hypothetical protein
VTKYPGPSELGKEENFNLRQREYLDMLRIEKTDVHIPTREIGDREMPA